LARNSKSVATATLPLSQAKTRLAAALREGRFMEALDLARQVYKAELNAVNQETLFNAYLWRCRQLRGQDKACDAATTLQKAVSLAAGQPARLGALAEELAACGQTRQALDLLTPFPDSPARGRVLARIADIAIRQEAGGRSLLPEEYRADFDRVLQAFGQLEANQHDAARETLQAISLRSPFLEWKLLLRGLHGYYQGDDARAVENWQRLTPDRLPARLAAPLRSRIDAAYRLAQPPPAQSALQQQADSLQDQSLIAQLRALRAGLSSNRSLSKAFRLAESILPILRQQAPDLVPRLAACFYWTIITAGHPDDVPHYQRVFGPPPDDPHFHRLQALACEHHHGWQEAHAHWQAYVASMGANSAAWPREQARRAQALVWLHMGRNAANVPDTDRIPNLPRFLRNHPDRPKPLKPPADKCYQNSIKLAPDLLEAHESLFKYHKERGQAAKAEKAARQLLKQFPEHGPTLEALADLLLESGHYAEAVGLFQRTLKSKPLDRKLRLKLSAAHSHNARSHAEAGRFKEARAEYEAALESSDGRGNSSVLCKWAACEFKAADAARAEELIGQALQQNGQPVAVAYSMLIEAIRLKLPKPLKDRFDREFKEALDEPPTGAAAAAALHTAATHRAAGVSYVGQKTHEKKVLAYLDRARSVDFTEDELIVVCTSLLKLQNIRALRTFCRLGAARFPRSAAFPHLEAESYFLKDLERGYDAWQAKPLLETAQRLAAEMPPDERRKDLLEVIGERLKLVELLQAGPFGFLQDVIDQLSDFEDADDGDWDDDDW
jgi:tetratricopeptide (TPR) repeat protein